MNEKLFSTKAAGRGLIPCLLIVVCLVAGLILSRPISSRAQIGGAFRILDLQSPDPLSDRFSLAPLALSGYHFFAAADETAPSKNTRHAAKDASYGSSESRAAILVVSIGIISLAVIIILLLIARWHRRRAAKSLKAARDRYQNMFNNTAVALFEEDFLAIKFEVERMKEQGVTDMQGYLDSHPQYVDSITRMLRIKDVNPAALRLYGADSKKDLLESSGRIFTSDSMDEFKKIVAAIAEGQTFFECETVSRKLTGQRIHILLNTTLPEKQEEFSSIIISILDITERKRSIEVMHRSEERFRNVFNNAASGMALVDLRGHYIRVNEAFQRMLGYTNKELEWKNWREVTYPDDVGLTKKLIISLIAGHQVQPMEKRYVTKQGKTFWALLNIALIVNKRRKPLYYITQVQDISKLKEEQELMQEREERYRQIFEADLSGFYIASPKGDLILCNRVFADIMGFAHTGEAVGMNLCRLFKNPEHFTKLLDQLTNRKKLEHVEAEFLRSDGTAIHVLLNGTGRFDGNGTLIEILGYVMDITREKSLEAQLLLMPKKWNL